jgi:hypothetical protein
VGQHSTRHHRRTPFKDRPAQIAEKHIQAVDRTLISCLSSACRIKSEKGLPVTAINTQTKVGNSLTTILQV